MISWFNTPFNSAILIAFVIIYNLIAAINNYDIRLLRDKKNENFPAGPQILPKWIRSARWVEPILFLIMLLLNWKFVLIAWIVKAILQALLVLEFIGYVILSAFNFKR